MSGRFFDLVIFDCDGVLVDSEMLSAGVLMSMMQEIGWPITEEIFRSDFLGRSFASAAGRARERFGMPLPEGFEAEYRLRLFAKMEGDLQPMKGVAEVLSTLSAPYCLATSSSPQRLEVSLRASGLAHFFRGRCFTGSQVPNGKPAPDLFLYAAERHGVEPRRCLVVEDSEMGVRAGLAAGMQVWHFLGGAHMRAGYQLPSSLVPHKAIDDMKSLQSAFSRSGLCGEVEKS